MNETYSGDKKVVACDTEGVICACVSIAEAGERPFQAKTVHLPKKGPGGLGGQASLVLLEGKMLRREGVVGSEI